MKRMISRSLMLVLTLTVLFACKKVEDIKFNIAYETTFIIQNGIGISTPVSILMSDLATNSESEFDTNNTRKENVEEIGLVTLNMEILSPSGDEFDFLEDIELFISADGVNETLLAYVYNMNNSVGTTVALTCAPSDFKEFIEQDKFTLRARIVSDEFISSDVEIKITSTFLVDAELID
ncbi:MAG: hypothetical protein HRT58_09340 [Crocinitomicaceae bacterium]|nr:hypothetical protein [Flavobacteriales bacterium]NQZ35857.1 hypothetical protein [Crocinitomicaceae bacterium]